MTLQAKLQSLTASHELTSADSSKALDRAITKLVGEEERSRPLKVGDPAPHFTLQTYGGETVSLLKHLESNPVVLTFYRGLWCPYCQRDLQSFARLIEGAEELGQCVLAISQPRAHGTDRPGDHGLGLNFPILEDDTGNLAVQYGIRWPQHEARMIEHALGLDLLMWRGTEPWINPMQARFVVDQDCKIAFAEVAFSYEERTEPDELLPLLARLNRGGN